MLVLVQCNELHNICDSAMISVKLVLEQCNDKRNISVTQCNEKLNASIVQCSAHD